MEKEQDPSPDYIIGFNQGYFMQQHTPELLQGLLAHPNDKSERIKAMNAGKKQFELEKFREQNKRKSQPEKDHER